jgi:diguanylate cyclase (GGDEF)-like protein
MMPPSLRVMTTVASRGTVVPSNEMFGRSAFEVLHSRYPDGSLMPREACLIHRAIREQRSFTSGEDYFLRRDGQAVPVRLSVAPVPDGGAVVVFADITTLKQMQAELRHQADTDALTGLANRRAFFGALQLAGERTSRQGDRCAVLMLDLDHFKAVNDRYGHAVGDATLRCFADILRGLLRGADCAGRLGGEEFALLLPQTDLAGAQRLAERIRLAVADGCRVPQHPELRMTVSIGAAELRPEDPTPEAALARADAALYRAKQGGRNRVVAAGTDDAGSAVF